MALSKITVLDQITVSEDGTILYREATRIIEDEVQLSQTYHRNSIAPASDLTGIPDNVTAIANVVWTPEVIKTYKDKENDNTCT